MPQTPPRRQVLLGALGQTVRRQCSSLKLRQSLQNANE